MEKIESINNGCCCRAETVALAYGIITAILTGLVSLCGVGYLINLFVTTKAHDTSWVLTLMLVIIVAVPCVVYFTFSLLLVAGVLKKNTCLIITYIVYGAVSIPIAIGIGITTIIYVAQVLGGLVIAVYLIYSLPLIAVWKAYQNLKSGRVYHQCNTLPMESV